MNCKQAKLLITKFGSDDINEEELKSLVDHTQQCSSCRKNAAFWEAWKVYNEESAIEEFFETFDEKNILPESEKLLGEVTSGSLNHLLEKKVTSERFDKKRICKCLPLSFVVITLIAIIIYFILYILQTQPLKNENLPNEDKQKDISITLCVGDTKLNLSEDLNDFFKAPKSAGLNFEYEGLQSNIYCFYQTSSDQSPYSFWDKHYLGSSKKHFDLDYKFKNSLRIFFLIFENKLPKEKRGSIKKEIRHKLRDLSISQEDIWLNRNKKNSDFYLNPNSKDSDSERPIIQLDIHLIDYRKKDYLLSLENEIAHKNGVKPKTLFFSHIPFLLKDCKGELILDFPVEKRGVINISLLEKVRLFAFKYTPQGQLLEDIPFVTSIEKKGDTEIIDFTNWDKKQESYICFVFKNTKVDKQKLQENLNQMAFKKNMSLHENMFLIKAWITKSLDVAKKTEIEKFIYLGQRLRDKKQFKQAEGKLHQALVLSEKHRSDLYQAYCYTSLGILYQKWKKPAEEIKSYLLSLQLKKEIYSNYFCDLDISVKKGLDSGIVNKKIQEKVHLSDKYLLYVINQSKEWLLSDEKSKKEYWITIKKDRLVIHRVVFDNDLIRGYINVGDYYNYLSMNGKAFQYYNVALRYMEYREELSKKDDRSKSLIALLKFNVGKYYSHLSRTTDKTNEYSDIARKFLGESLVIRESLYDKIYEILYVDKKPLPENLKIEYKKYFFVYARDVADTYVSLGKVYRDIGDLENALGYQNAAREIREAYELEGVYDSYINIMNVYTQAKNYQQALKYKNFIENKFKDKPLPNIYKLNFGVLHLKYANQIESEIQKQDEYKNAARYFDDILSYFQDQYNQTSWKFFSNSSYLYFKMGDYQKSWDLSLKAYEIARKIFEDEYIELPIKQKIARVGFDFERPFSAMMTAAQKNNNSSFFKIAYNAMIQQKELVNHILMQNNQRRKLLNTPLLKSKYKDFLDAFHLYQIALKSNNDGIKKYRDKYQNIALEIDRYVDNFSTDLISVPSLLPKKNKKNTNLGFADEIMQVLPKNTVVVDYCYYHSFDTGKMELGVFVLKSNTMNFYPLGDQEKIRQKIEAITENISKFNSDIPSEEKSVEYLSRLTYQLFRDIWLPLEKDLKNIKYVFISPHKELYNFPFGMISTKETPKYLIQQYNLIYVPSGKSLLKIDERLVKGFYGVTHPDFNFTRNSKNLTKYMNWSILPNDQQVENSKAHFRSFYNEEGKLHEKKEATEGNFELYSKNCRWLHIQTHGYYIKPNEEKYSSILSKQLAKESNYNPLQASHIVFAGANFSPPPESFYEGDNLLLDDGYLSAEEFALLGSSHDLFILIACNLGKGKYFPGVGQYAFRWAYEYSGGKYFIASLWELNKDVTNNIMTVFFDELSTSHSFEAFHNAKLEFLSGEESKRTSKLENFSHPYYWAPLTFQGNILPDIKK